MSRVARRIARRLGVAIGLAIGLAIVAAVLAESQPRTGAAFAATPEVLAYAKAEARAIDAVGLKASPVAFDARDPALHVHGFEAGSGPPTVFLHGGGGSAVFWAPLMARLSGRHLVALDRPGCGLTDGFDYSGVDLRRHAVAFVKSTLDALKIERATLIGNSMGALWSIWFALEHPERVEKLVFLGSPAGVPGTAAPRPMRALSVPGLGQLMGRLRTPSPENTTRVLAAVMGRHAVDQMPPELREAAFRGQAIPGSARSFRTLLQHIVSLTSGQLAGAGVTDDELRRLRPRVLWVWGDADLFGGADAARRDASAPPSSELVVLPGAGHLPWLDEPARVAQVVDEFLAK